MQLCQPGSSEHLDAVGTSHNEPASKSAEERISIVERREFYEGAPNIGEAVCVRTSPRRHAEGVTKILCS